MTCVPENTDHALSLGKPTPKRNINLGDIGKNVSTDFKREAHTVCPVSGRIIIAQS